MICFCILGRSGFRKSTCFCGVEVNNRPVKPGVIPPKAFLSKPFGARKSRVGNVATGVIGLTAPKVKAGGREGLSEGKVPIPALRADMILWDVLLLTFASPNFKLFFASGFCPDSLASLLTRNRPSE